MKLPSPGSSALARSQQLTSLIREEIEKSNGYMSFARFMALALFTPELGYYMNHDPKFGKTGDFVTASEISPLFAQCFARQFQPILEQLGGGDILELGAGSGIFAKDVLLELEKLGSLPQHYFILEISPALRSRQKKLFELSCPHLLSHVIWLEAFPIKMKGIIFANEVMDAMPVHCFRISNTSIEERCVAWKNNQFSWHITTPTEPQLIHAIKPLQLKAPYESEINLMLSDWIHSLGNALQKGVIFLIDYGYGQKEYYHPDRQQGTLTCFYQHHHHSNSLILVGLQDITAHVNFTTVIQSAVKHHLVLAGFTTQAAFLLACGLLTLAHDRPGVIENYQQNQEIKKLTLPSQMGEAVKVMGLSKNCELPLLGFTLHDRIKDL